jgi:hypothetical protein
MKVYVKKDKALKLLGEGKVYSKKDLVLKEQDGENALIGDVTSNDEQLQGATGLQNAVNKKSAENPAADGWSAELGNLNQGGGSAQQNGNGVIQLTKSQLAQPQTKQMLDRTRITNPNMQVNVMNDDKVQLAAHKTPKKVMDEMRENSVPFTKKEMTEFLKSL